MAEKDPATMADKDLDAVKDERIEYLDDEPIPYDDVSYGPGGMRGLWQSPYVVAAAFLASLGGFSFGYDQGVISIINTMEQFHEQFPRAATPFGKGFMTGMLEFGAFVGALAFPYLADRISRKRALSVVTVIFNIGAIMQTAAQDYGTLVAGRTIGGIGVGTLALCAPLYISEIAPPNIRGSLLVLESISIVSGVVISFWITYGTKDLAGDISFRLPLGLQMVSATLLAIFINFFPFSPRWLAMRDRSDDCLKSLSQLRRLPAEDSRVQAEFSGIMTEVRFQNIVQERRHPGVTGIKREMWSWLDLFRKKIWRRLVVGVGVAFFQQFSGINAFIYYAPTLFESLGQTPEMALILSGVFNCLQLVAVAVCFVVIDHVGRRPLAIWGDFGCCICYIIIAALSSVYEDDWSQNSAAGWACVAMAFMFILIYGVSYSPLGWALPPEVFPNSMRSKGVALSVATIWLCNFIIGVVTPPMLDSLGYGTYIFFAAWCGLAGVWAFLFIINIWRPIYSVTRENLAFLDASSIPDTSLRPVLAKFRRPENHEQLSEVTRKAFERNDVETWSVAPPEKEEGEHRWYYCKEMKPDGAILFKIFDSCEQEGVARRVPHTAFQCEEDSGEDRQSVAWRGLVLWDE